MVPLWLLKNSSVVMVKVSAVILPLLINLSAVIISNKPEILSDLQGIKPPRDLDF